MPVPQEYLDLIPPGSKVQVTLVVESLNEEGLSNQIEAEPVQHPKPSLEKFVAYLRSHPLHPSLITPVSTFFRAYLADSANADFDQEEWNQKWKQIESEMQADEEADIELTIKDMMSDLLK